MLPDLDDLDAWLAACEAEVAGLRPGCAKQVVWAGEQVKTPLSLVYVHGFSATGAELRPLPDQIADALGANLFFTRLTGHGQDGDAMGRARLPDWEADVAQAFEIGRALGHEVIVMGCSTGCTLLTSALAQGQNAKSVVHVSPNFGLHHRLAQALIDLPGVRRWGPWVAGRTRSFDPISDAHAAYWTVKYDTQAVFTMGDAVRAARASPIETIRTPAYFAYNLADEVVSARRIQAVIDRWGGRVVEDILRAGVGDDKMGHVMAGDVFSPGQTAPLAGRITDWLRGL